MAYEIELVNGVTKRKIGLVFYYYFPEATITVDTSLADPGRHDIAITHRSNPGLIFRSNFEDITDRLGAATAEAYADKLAETEFFFESINSKEKVLLTFYESNGKADDIWLNSSKSLNYLHNIQCLLEETNFLLKAIVSTN